jgi:hypothetical protein
MTTSTAQWPVARRTASPHSPGTGRPRVPAGWPAPPPHHPHGGRICPTRATRTRDACPRIGPPTQISAYELAGGVRTALTLPGPTPSAHGRQTGGGRRRSRPDRYAGPHQQRPATPPPFDAEHTFRTPAWTCRVCAQPWPCPTRKDQLAAEAHDISPAAVGVFLGVCLAQALHDMPTADPVQLYRRFLGWLSPARGQNHWLQRTPGGVAGTGSAPHSPNHPRHTTPGPSPTGDRP